MTRRNPITSICFALLAMCTVTAASPNGAAAAPSICSQLEGAIVIADGEYIGRISNRYDSDSVFNKFGTYGSKFATASIWNKFGTYGSKYSSSSATNPYTSTPPQIIVGRSAVGYLTRNRNLSGAIDPLVLGVTCYGYEPED